MIIYDHSVNPPKAYNTPCVVNGIGLPPDVSTCALPANCYLDGGTSTIPEGHRVLSSSRIVKNNRSVIEYVTEAITPAVVSAEEQARIAKLNASYVAYLQLCKSVGSNQKVGFAELSNALDNLKKENFMLAIELSVKLLAVNQQIIYYGGSWDACPNKL